MSYILSFFSVSVRAADRTKRVWQAVYANLPILPISLFLIITLWLMNKSIRNV